MVFLKISVEKKKISSTSESLFPQISAEWTLENTVKIPWKKRNAFKMFSS